LGKVKDPHQIILRPHITERSVDLSRGDERIVDDKEIVRKYVFEVAKDANKIEIKRAIEAIYNAGKKKKDEHIEVADVHTVTIRGKKRRRTWKSIGYQPDRKKAIVTLAKGQLIEDYGV
jgi:large subunit ribosomal protein L23